MKFNHRFIAVLFIVSLGILLAGCQNTTAEQPSETVSAQPSLGQEPEETTRTLVVYFSMPETTNLENMTEEEDNSAVVIDGEVLGNVQYVASIIQEHTGADIFRIETAEPYPTDHDDLVNQAAEEQEQNARPVLAANIDSLANYDTVFLGFPTWWADLPMAYYTFLEGVDLSGKTVIPFNVHGGSGFSGTVETIRQLQPGADVLSGGYSVSRDSVADSKDGVSTWVESLGLEL